MIRHERRTSAFALALFLTLFALCMEFVPGTMTASAKSNLGGPATVACSRVRFVGIRGSGEGYSTTEYDMGGVVAKVYTRFLSQMKNKGIAVIPEGVDYDAVPIQEYPVMQASVDGGVQTLTNVLNANKEDCVVLVGYSQGAWVIHDTLDDIHHNLPLSARLRVKAVLAFGDPYFNPQGRGSTFIGNPTGNDRRSGGIKGEKDFPSWVFGVQSYCKVYDPVCSSVLGGLAACAVKSWCQHFDYYNDTAILNQAASWLASLFPNLISTANSVHVPKLVTCSDHMKAPWIALYDRPNYGGESLCFEGTGWFDLDRYDFWNATYSVNIAANVVFYDGGGSQISYGYGFQTGDLGAWRRRIKSFSIES